MPANLDEVARGHERPELPLQAGALVFRHAEHLEQLLDGGRVVDLCREST